MFRAGTGANDVGFLDSLTPHLKTAYFETPANYGFGRIVQLFKFCWVSTEKHDPLETDG